MRHGLLRKFSLALQGESPSRARAFKISCADCQPEMTERAFCADASAAARAVASIAERVSSTKLPLSLQSAHSANSELAAYTNISRVKDTTLSSRSGKR